MTTEIELRQILNMVEPDISTNDTSSNQNNNSNGIDLIQDTNDLKPDNNEIENQKTKTTFAKNSFNRLIIISLITGGIIVGIGVFYQIFFAISSELGKDKIAENKEQNKTETPNLEETEANNKYRGQIAIFQQKDEIAAIEGATVEPPEIIVEEEPKATPEVKVQPKPIPKPKPPVARKPIVKPQPKPQSKPSEPEYDDISDWITLNKIGSYGYSAVSMTEEEQNTKTITPVLRRNTSEPTNSFGKIYNPSVNAHFKSQKDLETKEKATLHLIKNGEPLAKKIDRNAPKALIGQQIKAKLNNPLQAVAGNNQPQVVFLTLKEDILDNQNKTLIPKDSQLIYEWKIDDNGVIDGEIQSVIIEDKEISLAKKAISLKSKNGGLLVAKFKQIKNSSGNRNLIDFSLGVAEAASDILSQPSSSSTFISSNGSSSTSNFDDGNLPGAVVSEGASRVLKNRSDEINQQYQAAPTVGIWEVKENTDLILQINRSFSL